MDPKETIKKNLKRRSEFVDVVPTHEGIPMPTWVELSLIDVCNRKCTFCPKSDEKVAPDTFQKMTKKKLLMKFMINCLKFILKVQSLYVAMANHYCIKISHI